MEKVHLNTLKETIEQEFYYKEIKYRAWRRALSFVGIDRRYSKFNDVVPLETASKLIFYFVIRREYKDKVPKIPGMRILILRKEKETLTSPQVKQKLLSFRFDEHIKGRDIPETVNNILGRKWSRQMYYKVAKKLELDFKADNVYDRATVNQFVEFLK